MHTKEEIDAWLKKEGKNRQWLAEQCGVSYGSVNNWMSINRPIPAKALIIIDKLMEQANTPKGIEVDIPKLSITIHIPHQEFVEYSNLATQCGMGVSDFIIYVLRYAGDHHDKIASYIGNYKELNDGVIKKMPRTQDHSPVKRTIA